MSKKEANIVIKNLIKNVLESVSPREALDASVHILDVSYYHVMWANGIKTSKKSEESYIRFLLAVESKAYISISIDDAIGKVINNKGTQYIRSLNLLVAKNFNSARHFITEVSKLISEDEYFGTSYRERTLSELKTAYAIEEGGSLKPLIGKAFVIEGNRIGQVQEINYNNKPSYSIVPIYSSINSEFLALQSPTGDISIEPASKHMGARISLEDGTIQLIKTNVGELPLLKRQYLSKLDLGHLFKKKTLGGDTPLGIRLQDSLLYPGLSTKNRNIVQKYINQLDKAHGKVDYIFHNQAAEGSLTELSKTVGFVVLTVQYYKENNRLAVIEGRIKREITKKFKEIAATLPGSNTIVEDIIDKVRNSIVKALGGNPKALKPHDPIPGTVPIVNNSKIKIFDSEVKGPSKTKKPSKSNTKLPQLRTNLEQGSSLISLQSLINNHLQDVISANMGDGSRKNILNYRTGRFASTVKVEQMTQSRAGMITAFYSYMKNPYATFSKNGRQSVPASRDPKLLIAKSIREIAATKVGNRMRSVSL